MTKHYDRIVIGAGIYGMYAAKTLAEKGYSVALLESDSRPFERATYVNQARLHSGYHYPRSNITAEQSIRHFFRFYKDFRFAINDEFEKIYAISKDGSKVDAEQFKNFCDSFGIRCEEIDKSTYFQNGKIEAAFSTTEYSFDAQKIRDYFVEEVTKAKNIDTFFGTVISSVDQSGGYWYVKDAVNDRIFISSYAINTTYASTNQIIEKFGKEKFGLKYELCEVILCDTSERLNKIGLTVMDGPFFSIMPFGLQGCHSLTSVQHTPHSTSYDALPKFNCQRNNAKCSEYHLENCNHCKAQPETAWNYMSELARQFLNDDIDFKYRKSIYAIKSILLASEDDDGRPTIIRNHTSDPTFISVLSGKINTFYEMDHILQ